jgi:hypothetical protein
LDRRAGERGSSRVGATTLGDDVDFVVVGFGLGALGVLVGVVMLGWLAPRSQRAAARASAADEAARGRAIAAEHRGTGQALLYAGGAMLLATVAGLLGSLDDRTGALLVSTTATVAAVGILLGGYLHRVRNPAPPRRRTRFAPIPSASIVATPPPDDSPPFLADEPSTVPDPASVESDGDGPHAGILPTSDSGGEAFVAEEMAPLPSAASGALSSNLAGPGSPGDSPVAAETPDSGSWRPVDHVTGNGSSDRDHAETEETTAVGHVAPVARATQSSPTRPDEDDPSSADS